MLKKGFTFLEIVIALSIFAVAMLGFFQILRTAMVSSYRATDELIATNLARGLMAEIISKDFADPQQPMNDLGLDSAEAARNDFDDVDDYDGLNESPPYTPEADPMNGGGPPPRPNYSGFSRTVNVVFCDISGSDIVEVAGTDYDTSDYKKITVTVSGPYARGIVLDELKTRPPD